MERSIFRWITDFGANGILVTDTDLRIRYCNAWIEKNIGGDTSALTGCDLFTIFPSIRDRGFARYYYDALNGQNRIFSHRLHKYLLPMSPVLATASFAQMQQTGRISPLFENGRVIGTVTIIEDVTERVVREAELNAQIEERERLLASELAARQLAEKNSRLKDEFLATVSHEVRAPLNAIKGWTQILLTEELDDAQKEHALDTIRRNVNEQTRIIEDLLDISRIVSGQLRIEMQPVSIAEIIKNAVDSVSPAAAAKEIHIVTEIDGSISPVLGDAHRLQQVMWNLMSNAVKFTPAKGTVEVSLRTVNDFAEVRVRDTGIGISPEFLPFVFERFRQADGSSKRVYGGLGLGLSIVKNLVEMHGGTIIAESEGEGRGTTFTVELPLHAIKKVENRSDTHGMQLFDKLDSVAGRKIMVVDDDADSREMLTILLKYGRAEVMAAASVTEALDKIAPFNPDLLISDLAMPEMDGYDLIEKIRAMPAEEGGCVPAIALTGYVSAEEKQRVRESGFNTHLAKPVDQSSLIKAINELLDDR